jgi:hypothetical protein
MTEPNTLPGLDPKWSLDAIALKLKQASSGDTAPLVFASAVIELGNNWDARTREAKGLTFKRWLLAVSGRDYTWWARRAAAAETLGQWSKRILHHDVACYIVQSVQPADREAVCAEIRTRSLGHVRPLTIHAAAVYIKRLLKKTTRTKRCANCTRLEAELALLNHQSSTKTLANIEPKISNEDTNAH